MSRQQKDPLRPLRDMERVSLVRLSRSASAPAAQVARARALLAVAEGLSYTSPHKESSIGSHEAPFIWHRKPISMSDSFRGLVLSGFRPRKHLPKHLSG